MHKAHMDHEYAGITGLPKYCKAAIGLALGDDNPVLKAGLVWNLHIYIYSYSTGFLYHDLEYK